MWVSLVGALIVGGWLFMRTMISASRTMARRLAPTTQPRTPEPAATVWIAGAGNGNRQQEGVCDVLLIYMPVSVTFP